MTVLPASDRSAGPANPLWWQVPLLLVVSTAIQSMFLDYGINRLDEGWPLYAAMQMHAGGVLYDDVLWVFPPGHVLPAWIATWLAPPGFKLARIIYSGFDVALVVSVLFLARRIMPASFALLAALLVAFAAPRSHFFQLLFGFRYLVLTVIVLLAFARRIDSGDVRWMFAAGVGAGVALFFRLTPAFAVSCGVGVAVMAASTDWRRWLRDWSAYALGLLAVMIPVLAWFAWTVGLPKLWHEVLIHPLGMLQPLPPPPIEIVNWSNRISIHRWFVAVQFRAHWFFYGGYVLAVGWLWVRARMAKRSFDHVLLVAIVIWGGVYFIRSLGRSDEAHLDSAIPPVCLLFAHLCSVGFRALGSGKLPARLRVASEAVLAAAVLGAWVYLLGFDLYLEPERRGRHLIETTAELGEPLRVYDEGKARQIDRVVRVIRNRTLPGESILNMAETPMFHVLTGRLGPGYFDVMMPGTFMNDEEELWFLERLKADPPGAVIWPARSFDDMPERDATVTAPRISEWVRANYEMAKGKQHRWYVMLPPKDKRRTAPID